MATSIFADQSAGKAGSNAIRFRCTFGGTASYASTRVDSGIELNRAGPSNAAPARMRRGECRHVGGALVSVLGSMASPWTRCSMKSNVKKPCKMRQEFLSNKAWIWIALRPLNAPAEARNLTRFEISTSSGSPVSFSVEMMSRFPSQRGRTF